MTLRHTPEKQRYVAIVEPAIAGVVNCLRAAAQVPTVKVVVYTSSITAVQCE